MAISVSVGSHLPRYLDHIAHLVTANPCPNAERLCSASRSAKESVSCRDGLLITYLVASLNLALLPSSRVTVWAHGHLQILRLYSAIADSLGPPNGSYPMCLSQRGRVKVGCSHIRIFLPDLAQRNSSTPIHLSSKHWCREQDHQGCVIVGDASYCHKAMMPTTEVLIYQQSRNLAITHPPDVSPITVPILLGHLFNWGLFGVLTVQIYIYYIAFPKDNYKPKLFVGLAYILEIIQVVVSTCEAVRVFGNGWGNPVELSDPGLLWLNIVILTGFISSLSQLFYAWRVWALSGNRWLTSIVTLIAVAAGGCAIYVAVIAYNLRPKGLLEVIRRAHNVVIIWVSCGLFGQMVITCSIMFYLRQARRSTEIKHTTTLITRLITFSAESGIVCTTISVTGLILFITSPNTSLFELPTITASKLFSNCFIAVLNSRAHILNGRDDRDPGGSKSFSSFHLNSLSYSLSQPRVHARLPRPSNQDIVIEISRITDSDMQSDSGDKLSKTVHMA
ncbi:hypothetical protein BXZ70DRAFT_954760 [Cristinia sonorae]|uniref:DUF6534 domain-containing protein n=1 Tax=Cristinia sonorae TaxID=1940300 RepID=A0A8K0XLV5_9AGAR|nr:hypothetical protein BXZ70DRAFT_954760 [Cristinia sonorae]